MANGIWHPPMQYPPMGVGGMGILGQPSLDEDYLAAYQRLAAAQKGATQPSSLDTAMTELLQQLLGAGAGDTEADEKRAGMLKAFGLMNIATKLMTPTMGGQFPMQQAGQGIMEALAMHMKGADDALNRKAKRAASQLSAMQIASEREKGQHELAIKSAQTDVELAEARRQIEIDREARIRQQESHEWAGAAAARQAKEHPLRMQQLKDSQLDKLLQRLSKPEFAVLSKHMSSILDGTADLGAVSHEMVQAGVAKDISAERAKAVALADIRIMSQVITDFLKGGDKPTEIFMMLAAKNPAMWEIYNQSKEGKLDFNTMQEVLTKMKDSLEAFDVKAFTEGALPPPSASSLTPTVGQQAADGETLPVATSGTGLTSAQRNALADTSPTSATTPVSTGEVPKEIARAAELPEGSVPQQAVRSRLDGAEAQQKFGFLASGTWEVHTALTPEGRWVVYKLVPTDNTARNWLRNPRNQEKMQAFLNRGEGGKPPTTEELDEAIRGMEEAPAGLSPLG